MSNIKATKAFINLKIKSWAGLRYRQLIETASEMSTVDFWQFQAHAFKEIYEFARRHVPYYRKRSDIYRPLINGGDDALSMLALLPILKKQTVREYNSELWAQPLSPGTKFHTTSGTSGTPLRLPANIWEKGFSQAVTEQWYCQICGSRSPRTLNLSGFLTPSSADNELYWVDSLSRHVYLSIYSLNKQRRDEVVKVLDNFRPQLIYGYASAVHQLALLLGDAVESTKDDRVAVVTSEVLQLDWRAAIESNLCGKAYDNYGSQEGCHRVLQCRESRMHIHPMVGIVEILDEQDRPAQLGTFGKVVVTGLAQRSMPLIRYDLGDTALSTGYASDCDCGLQWPTIGSIAGRSEELIRTRDGRNIGMLGYHAAKDLVGIKEMQIIQRDYERFICKIVKSETDQVSTDFLEDSIRVQLIKRLSTDVHIDFEYPSNIPRSSNGKIQAVIVDFDKRANPIR